MGTKGSLEKDEIKALFADHYITVSVWAGIQGDEHALKWNTLY